MKAVYSSGANRDIRDTLDYYRREAGPDIASDFHSELYELVNRIKRSPQSFPLIHPEIRRAVMKRFPFQVTFRADSTDEIRILAVRHHGRRPDFGLER